MDPVNRIPAKIRNVDKEFARQLYFRAKKFRVHKKGCAKIEKQRNISTNVFGYGDETL